MWEMSGVPRMLQINHPAVIPSVSNTNNNANNNSSAGRESPEKSELQENGEPSAASNNSSLASMVSDRQCEFFRMMDKMRRQGELCDVSLSVEQQELRVHKVVMAACSSFFHAMFTSCMSEAHSSRVELKDVSYETVSMIVDFAYTADIELTDNNVQELLSAANRYQIEPIKEACCDYLKGQLSSTNCIGIRDFADFHNCPELYQGAVEFIDEHFLEVCQGEEFLQQGLESITELLSRDQLTIKCEDEVFDAAVRWLEHEDVSRLCHKRQVFNKVRFPLITRRYLTSYVQNHTLLQDCCACLQMVIGGMKYHLLGQEEKLGQEVNPRVKKYHFKVAVFAGSDQGSCQYFDPKDHSWADIPPMSEKRRNHTVASVDNKVFIFGGSYLFPVSRIDCFNVATNRWSVMSARLENSRDSLAACTYRDRVLTCGGTQSHGTSSLKNVEWYYAKHDRVFECRPMNQSRYDHQIVECRNHLYVCGGASARDRPLRHCEKYNPATNKWTEIPAMNVCRRGLGLAVVDNKIYAFGGSDENGPLDTVECFDAVFGRWTFRSKMPYKLSMVKCEVVGESIWILSANRDVAKLSNVLEYRPREDNWVLHYNTKCFSGTSAGLVTVDTCVVE